MSSNLTTSTIDCLGSECKICDTDLTSLNFTTQNSLSSSSVSSSISNYQKCEQCYSNSSCPYVNYVPTTTTPILSPSSYILSPRDLVPPDHNSTPLYPPIPTLKIKLLSDQARVPIKANNSDAGYDLFALEDGIIQPGQRVMIKTGISMAIPLGYYGRIAPRSGLAWKNGIDILAGVVDSGYRGPVNVIAINTTSGEQQKSFEYKARDAIAQIIIECCANLSTEVVSELDDTSRGSGGFGSTGTRNQ